VKNFKIKSYSKINLYLKVIKKLNNGYHNIASLITFCDLHDVLLISKIKSKRDNIIFSGKFKYGINNKANTISKLLNLLRKNNFIKNDFFKISIIKNIPTGSGLGGGSSNAANLLNYLNKKMKLKLNKEKMKKLASQIGFDVPISLEKKNTYLSGKRTEIFRLEKKFKLNLLIVYPNLICSTRKIYKKNRITNKEKFMPFSYNKKNEKFIEFLKNEKNDLEKTVIKIYPKIKELIDFIKSQKGCHFSRITGSGSACIGIFSNSNRAINAQKLVKLKYPKYWCVVSKSI